MQLVIPKRNSIGVHAWCNILHSTTCLKLSRGTPLNPQHHTPRAVWSFKVRMVVVAAEVAVVVLWGVG